MTQYSTLILKKVTDFTEICVSAYYTSLCIRQQSYAAQTSLINSMAHSPS
jgi:hypothetical protein